MTCNFTVGRCGVDLQEVRIREWSISGDVVRVAGKLKANSVTAARVLRQQLNGYLRNPDEPVVPVSWLEDPTVDGFYRVLDAEVATTRVSMFRGLFDFSLTLERVRGFSAPIIETKVVGAVRANEHGIVESTGSTPPNGAMAAIAIPAARTEYSANVSSAGSAKFDRTTGTGVVHVPAVDDFTPGFTQTWTVPIADYYAGAATVMFDGDPVVGQQVRSESTGWLIDNGLIRVSTPSNAGIDVSAFDGTAWSAAKRLRLLAIGHVAGNLGPAAGVRILRNSPEECIVRIAFETSESFKTFQPWTRVNLDVALRRGERTARFLMSSNSDMANMGAELVTAEAGTIITGGLVATSADADGNKYVFGFPDNVTEDTTQGGFERSATNGGTLAFCFGLEVGSAQANDVAQQLVWQYMAATSERAVVAAR